MAIVADKTNASRETSQNKIETTSQQPTTLEHVTEGEGLNRVRERLTQSNYNKTLREGRQTLHYFRGKTLPFLR